MSHFTEIKTQIKDIEALRCACRELGFALLQNAEARGYYENKTKGDYVIQLKGPYDIALNKQPDGTFGLTAGAMSKTRSQKLKTVSEIERSWPHCERRHPDRSTGVQEQEAS